MTTLYLGIGYPKTATTSIQRFLIDNRHHLWELGYYYPLTGIVRRSGRYNSVSRYGHANLAWELKQLPAYDPHAGDFSELLREIGGLRPRNVIIHFEGFADLKPDKIGRIREIFDEFDVKIVVYLRRQDKFIESLYCQFVKMFLPDFSYSFPEYLAKANDILDYHSTLKSWSNIFGRENMIVRIFEEEAKGGIERSFLHAIGLDAGPLLDEFILTEKAENITPSVKMIKLMRIVNIILLKNSILPEQHVRFWGNKLMLESATLRKIVSLIPDFTISNQLLTPAQRESFLNNYKESNNALAGEFLKRSNFWGLEDA